MVYCLFEQSGTFKNEFKKLILVAKRRNLKLILENPYTSQHFLKLYWALKPTIIDNDRRLGGGITLRNLHNIGLLIANLLIILFLVELKLTV